MPQIMAIIAVLLTGIYYVWSLHTQIESLQKEIHLFQTKAIQQDLNLKACQESLKQQNEALKKLQIQPNSTKEIEIKEKLITLTPPKDTSCQKELDYLYSLLKSGQ